MSWFSERLGFKKKIHKQLQSMDNHLETRIWNLMTMFLWDCLNQTSNPENELRRKEVIVLSKQLWDQFFKEPLDSYCSEDIPRQLKNKYNLLKWYEIYDLIEFVIQNYPIFPKPKFITTTRCCNNLECFKEMLNNILKEESSAYRIIGNKVTEITSDDEIREIEEAIDNSPNEVQIHLHTALTLLSDRNNPDYRNSIKESISSVETIARKISSKEKATLGDALTILKKDKNFNDHPALMDAFKKIYGYTNDKDGIRHSLMNEDKLDAEDARYMLVSCSAFVNYLRVKADKAGIII